MRRLKFFFVIFCFSLPNAYALSYNGSNYLVYEIAPAAGNPGTLYITPKIIPNLMDVDLSLQTAMSVRSVLPKNAPAYQFTISIDGHLSAPINVANFTEVNARKLKAIKSPYKLYDGHFKGGSTHTFLLQGNGNRDSVLLDVDANSNPYIYYNFGAQFDSSKTSLIIKDFDGNGFDDIETVMSNNYTKVAFYSSSLSLTVAGNFLQARQLGLLINDNDPYSVAIGEYYRVHRSIPSANIVHLQIPLGVASLDRNTFATIKASVDAALPATVQALAVAWTTPYAVECNSITSALARGFASGPCDTDTKNFDSPSPYYNSPSSQPYSDYKMRPAMLLAAHSIVEGESLIDRGIASDGTKPQGIAHIMNVSSEPVRSGRAINFPSINLGFHLSSYVNVQIDNANSISGTNNTLFYFQAMTLVPNIATNSFPNGAVADTLTSCGGMLAYSASTVPAQIIGVGQLNDCQQGSVLDFISGGATGTFGTVSEPSGALQKFPDPSIAILRYTSGEPLIEAYWKSISQTFQGLFIGEPLARPWQ